MAAAKKGGASVPTDSGNVGAQPANIPAATEFNPSGAPNQVVPDVDASHPAVDSNPRAGTSVEQNQIDFNDPIKPGHEVVAEQLGLKPKADEA